jgi:hypothetical protein
LPPRPGHLVLGGADRLLGAAAGLDRHQVAVALRGDEAEHAVVAARQLDQDDALARARQEVDLLGRAQHRARLPRGGDDRLVAGDDFATPTTSAPSAGRA